MKNFLVGLISCLVGFVMVISTVALNDFLTEDISYQTKSNSFDRDFSYMFDDIDDEPQILDLSYMFDESYPKTVNLSDFPDTSTVMDFSYMFDKG